MAVTLVKIQFKTRPVGKNIPGSWYLKRVQELSISFLCPIPPLQKLRLHISNETNPSFLPSWHHCSVLLFLWHLSSADSFSLPGCKRNCLVEASGCLADAIVIAAWKLLFRSVTSLCYQESELAFCILRAAICYLRLSSSQGFVYWAKALILGNRNGPISFFNQKDFVFNIFNNW